MKMHLIMYVRDQARSASFYRAVLAIPPELDVPGMTEFVVSTGAVLGLMPEEGIRRLLSPALTGSSAASRVLRTSRIRVRA